MLSLSMDSATEGVGATGNHTYLLLCTGARCDAPPLNLTNMYGLILNPATGKTENSTFEFNETATFICKGGKLSLIHI